MEMQGVYAMVQINEQLKVMLGSPKNAGDMRLRKSCVGSSSDEREDKFILKLSRLSKTLKGKQQG